MSRITRRRSIGCYDRMLKTDIVKQLLDSSALRIGSAQSDIPVAMGMRLRVAHDHPAKRLLPCLRGATFLSDEASDKQLFEVGGGHVGPIPGVGSQTTKPPRRPDASTTGFSDSHEATIVTTSADADEVAEGRATAADALPNGRAHHEVVASLPSMPKCLRPNLSMAPTRDAVRWRYDTQKAQDAPCSARHSRKLLLVHGLGGSWQSWSTILDAVIQHRTVVALDLPGHGTSPAGGDSGTFCWSCGER